MSLASEQSLESAYVMGTFARKPVELVRGSGMAVFAVGADGGMLYNNMYGIDINGSMTCHGVNSARTAANTAHEFISGK